MHPELFTIPGLNFAVPGYGLMVLIAFLSATWWMTRRARQVKLDPDLVLNLAFISLVTSTIGARSFYVLHYWKERFRDNPSRIFEFSSGGFEVYGGLIGAFVCCYLYIWWKRQPLRIFADIAAPSILLGMGIGRIGCFLFGCCWGGLCSPDLPWAVQFPFASPPYNRQWDHRQVTAPADLLLIDAAGMASPIPREVLKLSVGEIQDKVRRAEKMLADAQASGKDKRIKRAQAAVEATREGANQVCGHYDRFETTPTGLADRAVALHLKTLPLHPSQLYGAVGPLLLAFLTSAYFYRRHRHGTVMPLGFMLYAVERFVEEVVRSDNPHDTFGLTISQGVSVVVFLVAGAVWLMLLKLPLRSEAKPWLPPVKST